MSEYIVGKLNSLPATRVLKPTRPSASGGREDCHPNKKILSAYYFSKNTKLKTASESLGRRTALSAQEKQTAARSSKPHTPHTSQQQKKNHHGGKGRGAAPLQQKPLRKYGGRM